MNNYQIITGDWIALFVQSNHHTTKTVLHILQIRGQRQYSHHFTGNGNIEASFPGHVLFGVRLTDGDTSQETIICVHN
jgi:hypothetical protein